MSSLINPSEFPTIDTTTIEPASKALKDWGADLLKDVQAVQTEWKKLAGCYQAPEQEQVYALQDKPVASAEDVKADFEKAAKALDEYATALAPIKKDLDALAKEAAEFRVEAEAGYEESWTPPVLQWGAIGMLEMGLEAVGVVEKRHVSWEDHKPAFDKNNDLLAQFGEIMARLNAAENDCAAKLYAIAGANLGVCYATPEDLPAGAFVGEDADGNGMPWGSIGEYSPENCGEGAYWATNEFVWGFGALVGVSSDYDGIHWEWETAGNAWGGVLNLVGSVAIVASPTLNVQLTLAMVGIETPGSDFLLERGDVAYGFVFGLLGFNYAAARQELVNGGDFGDAWGEFASNWTTNPGGAGATTLLNVASILLPTKGLSGALRGSAAARLLAAAEIVGVDSRLGLLLTGAAKVMDGSLTLSGLMRGLGEVPISDLLKFGDDAVRWGDEAGRLADDAGRLSNGPGSLTDNALGLGDDAARLADDALSSGNHVSDALGGGDHTPGGPGSVADDLGKHVDDPAGGGDINPGEIVERTDQTGIDAPPSGTKYNVNTEFADGAYTYDRTPDPARVAADKAWNAANDQLQALGKKYDMSPSDLNKGLDTVLDELLERGASRADRIEAADLWEARKDAMTSRVETGEAMAQVEVAHLIAQRGEVPVNGAGELTGPGTFDDVSYPKGNPTQITIWEAKGGYQGKSPGAFLEKANVPDSSGGTITAQQGSTPYVNSLITKDPALLQHLKGLTDEQLGRLQFSYNVVHMQPNGVVKVYPVKLDAAMIDLQALKAVVRAG